MSTLYVHCLAVTGEPTGMYALRKALGCFVLWLLWLGISFLAVDPSLLLLCAAVGGS